MKSISICACDVGIFYTCNAVGNACLHKASSRLFFIRFVLKCWWIIFPCFNQKKKKKQTNRRNRFILESNDCFVCFELFIWSGYFKIAISRIADCWVSLRGRQELMLVAGGWWLVAGLTYQPKAWLRLNKKCLIVESPLTLFRINISYKMLFLKYEEGFKLFKH